MQLYCNLVIVKTVGKAYVLELNTIVTLHIVITDGKKMRSRDSSASSKCVNKCVISSLKSKPHTGVLMRFIKL